MSETSIQVYFGDTIVTITGDSILDVMKKKALIENLNTSYIQEGLSYNDVTPTYYETKEGYEYFGFKRHDSGATVTFGKARETTDDPDAQYFPKRIGSENYTGFRERGQQTPQNDG